jgi:hypothetical protein
MSVAITKSASNPSAQWRVGSFPFAPFAAVGWVLFALLGLAVRVALYREHRTQGTVSLLWGLGFALFLWFGVWTLGLGEGRAIPFALVAGMTIALVVYLRGAALENPPAEQPGAFLRRRRVRRRRISRTRSAADATKARELLQARVALDFGKFAKALYLLQEAERVAVAQRKPDELLQVRELVTSLSARSGGRTRKASERLARKVSDHLRGFPSDASASVGVRDEPERDLIGLLLARPELRVPAGGEMHSKTRELIRARSALDDGDFATALHLLQEARRVAVAQRRLGELLEVHELVRVLATRSSGRTRAASEQLARKVETGLRSFV